LFLCPMDEAMRHECIGANLDFLKLVVDSQSGTDFSNTLPYPFDPISTTELLNQEWQVRLSLGRSIGIEKERSPLHVVLEIWIAFQNDGDCPLKTAKADKAPRANDVRDDFDS